jgi:hypothetical protein
MLTLNVRDTETAEPLLLLWSKATFRSPEKKERPLMQGGVETKYGRMTE